MRSVGLFIAGFAGLVLWSSFAEAECRWEWICDEHNNCSHQPVCESTLDIPPPKPPSIQPIVPPSIRPLESPTLQPVGTSNCSQVRRCDSLGNCFWDTACY